ncbi:MBL fold metallo-hydrolase [Frankia nepalensis]|nr:MBL fold metallo-hydrolase [Frankia nepalensis]
MPAGGQCSSSYLVETDSTRVLLDCGPGAMTALSAVMRPWDLDGVIISHLHLDHCYDLLPLGKAMLAGRVHRSMGSLMTIPTLPEMADYVDRLPVPLYVPRGGRETLNTLATLFPVTTIPLLDKAFEVAFEVREYTPGDLFTISDLEIGLHELRHAVPNCGIRVESSGGSLAYTGDTGFTDALVPLARNVDLLLSEATLAVPDGTAHGHLCATEAGTVARAAGVGQLVLTHFATAEARWLEARKADAERVFDGPVRLAAPAGQFDVRYSRKVMG